MSQLELGSNTNIDLKIEKIFKKNKYITHGNIVSISDSGVYIKIALKITLFREKIWGSLDCITSELTSK